MANQTVCILNQYKVCELNHFHEPSYRAPDWRSHTIPKIQSNKYTPHVGINFVEEMGG